MKISTGGFRVRRREITDQIGDLVELSRRADLWGMERIWERGEKRGYRAFLAYAEPQVFAQHKMGVVECLYCLLKIG